MTLLLTEWIILYKMHNLLWPRSPHPYNGRDNSTHFTGLLWGLCCKITSVKHYLTHSKYSMVTINLASNTWYILWGKWQHLFYIPSSQLSQTGHVVSLHAICTLWPTIWWILLKAFSWQLTPCFITNNVLLLTIFLSQPMVSLLLHLSSVNSAFIGFSELVSSWSWWTGAHFSACSF